MNVEKIKEALIGLLEELFADTGFDADLLECMDFADDLGMDSTMFITLIVEIEAAFNIIVPDDLLRMEHFKNMDDVLQLVATLLIEKTTEEEAERYDKA